jgi:hypothetical protein
MLQLSPFHLCFISFANAEKTDFNHGLLLVFYASFNASYFVRYCLFIGETCFILYTYCTIRWSQPFILCLAFYLLLTRNNLKFPKYDTCTHRNQSINRKGAYI